MTTPMSPQAGDLACARISGFGGGLIGLGERLYVPENVRKITGDWQHVFVYLGGDQIVQAEPGGAQLTRLSHYDGQKLLWSSSYIPLTPVQRQAICEAARDYTGVPYSGLDYMALAAHRLDIPLPHLKAYIASTGHMICSQLADQCYADADVHLFNDNRWPGFVTPADLAGRFLGLEA